MIEKLGNYALTTKKSHLLVYYTISSCLCGQINACIKQLTKQAIYFTGSFSLASRLSLACLKKSENSYFESLIKIHFFVRFLSAFGLSSFLTRLVYRVQLSEKSLMIRRNINSEKVVKISKKFPDKRIFVVKRQ